jgi:carboxymethylenebutenolidase
MTTPMSMTITTPDGAFGAYVAEPKGPAPSPSIIVIQEIYGVNAVMRGVADHLADIGYLAVCPDLFWRIAPGIDLTDQTDAGNARAFELFGLFNVETGVEDIAATLAAVRADPRCNGKVGAVGYCLGGLLAYLTATRTDIDAAVGYYGVSIDTRLDEAEKLAAPLMLHIAEEDAFVDAMARQRIMAGLKNHPHVILHTYAGRGHAFARVGGDHYDAADAVLANARTDAFFAKSLKS